MIDADEKEVVFALDARLAALPDATLNTRGISWTQEMDSLLLKYWNVKRKQDVARELGVAENTARDRYRQLTC